MPTVTNTVLKPDGTLAAGVRVRIRLVASDPVGAPGFVGASDRTIISEAFVLTTSAGVWTAVLEANANISPANTVYEITELVGAGVSAYYVSVPAGAGPYWTGDILASLPAGIESARLAVSQGPESLAVYTGQASPFPKTIANNVDVQVDFRSASDGVTHDPLSMIQTTSYVSDTFGETWGPGSWMRLGLGIWLLSAVVKWDGNVAGDREQSLGVMDDRQGTVGIDGFWWAPISIQNVGLVPSRVPASTLSSGLAVQSSITAVTPQMLAASDGQSAAGSGVAVGFNVFQNSGGSRTITYAFITASKLSSYPVSV